MNDNKEALPNDLYNHDWDAVNEFRQFVNNYNAKYKVCVSHVCFNLLYPYCNCFTHNALFAMIPEISYHYILFSKIPSILIVDTCLNYGENINSLLNTFISELYEAVSKMNSHISLDTLEKDVVKNLTISTMLNKNSAKMLKFPFLKRFIKPHESDGQMDAKIYHCNEMVISHYKLNNGCLSCKVNNNIVRLIEHKMSLYGFKNMMNNDDKNYLSFLCDKNDIKAVLSLQVVKQPDNVYIVPNFLASKLYTENSFSLYSKIFSSELVKKLYKYIDVAHISNALLHTVLCYNICTFLNIEDFLDKERIKAHFGNCLLIHQLIDELFMIKTPFLSLEEMANFSSGNIGTMTDEPLDNRNINIETQDMIADIYKEQALRAFDFQNGLCLSLNENTMYTTNLKALSNMVNLKVNPHSKDEYTTIFNELMNMQNLGILDLYYDYDGTCEIVVNDLASMIIPIRYALYLPVLRDIEQKCHKEPQKIISVLESLYEDDTETCKALISYTSFLYASGSCWEDMALVNYYDVIGTMCNKNHKIVGLSTQTSKKIHRIDYNFEVAENRKKLTKLLKEKPNLFY